MRQLEERGELRRAQRQVDKAPGVVRDGEKQIGGALRRAAKRLARADRGPEET